MSRLLLLTDDASFERRLRLAFGGSLNGDLKRLDVATIDPTDPVWGVSSAPSGDDDALEVVIVGPGIPSDKSLQLAERFDRDRPDVSVVVVAGSDPGLWARAMRAGARDVLDPESGDAEIRDVLRRASDTSLHRRQAFTGNDLGQGRGRVISVMSPRGGSGKTTLATNLAVGLAPSAPGDVVLIDADLQFGDAATMMQLVPEHTVADAAPSAATGDPMALKVYLTAHPANLYVLCAPGSPGDGERVSGQQLAQVIDVLASEFRYVVVDTGAGFNPTSLAAAEVSTDLVLVASMDVVSTRGLSRLVSVLDQTGPVGQRRHFVLNRADSRVGLTAEEVTATVGLPVDVTLPSTRLVPLAVNDGIPLLLSAPRAPIGRQLRKLVDRFVQPPAEQLQTGWFATGGGR